MDKVHSQILLCLTAYAHGLSAGALVPGFTAEDWDALRTAAAHHKLEAVIYGTLGRNTGFCGGDAGRISQWRQRAYTLSMTQSQRTARLLELTAALEQAEVPYAVVKGAVCRSLYKNGDLRVSGDEDLYIPLGSYARCGEILTHNGFRLNGGKEDGVTHWFDRSGLHIELHTRLADRDDQEALFADFMPVRLQMGESSLFTLPPALHLSFLVYHARKHLITGGVGIRTLCDIALFYSTWRKDIDPGELYELLKKLQCTALFHHILAIGRDELGIECSDCPIPRRADDLLWDVLDAGIYGQSTLTRRHSGTLSSQNESGKQSLLRVLFPARPVMEARFPVLKEKPGLLPVMWLRRLGRYGLETLSGKDSSPTGSLLLSKKRTEMLVKYEIISKDPRKSS